MQTAMLDARTDLAGSVSSAVEVLRLNGLVALPSETVYGLAGSALASEAVARIFEAKKRPYFDPLIVHIASPEWLPKLARCDSPEWPLVAKIIDRFWPGPLTIVLPKTDLLPDLVTAGLPSVAIRMPSHPVFVEVLRKLGEPLAAPSANRFGRVSPTRAEHVFEELQGRIPLILDAGPTTVGLESTIVRVIEHRIEILRPGPITEEALNEVASADESHASEEIVAPGQTTSHYAPEKRVYLLDIEDLADHSKDSALICWGPVHHTERFFEVRSLSENYNLLEAAQRLFQLLREIDQMKTVKQIFVEPVPERGLGKAIMNRIGRAVAPRRDAL
jgi:L-threonylcarbamoyladenylate synthase